MVPTWHAHPVLGSLSDHRPSMTLASPFCLLSIVYDLGTKQLLTLSNQKTLSSTKSIPNTKPTCVKSQESNLWVQNPLGHWIYPGNFVSCLKPWAYLHSANTDSEADSEMVKWDRTWQRATTHVPQGRVTILAQDRSLSHKEKGNDTDLLFL